MMTQPDLTLQQALLQAAHAAGEQIEHRPTKHGQGEAQDIKGESGLVAYLKAQALATPGSFLTLLGKVAADETDRQQQPIIRIELVAAKVQKTNEYDCDDE